MSKSARLEWLSDRLRVTGDISPGNVCEIRNEGERLIAEKNQDVVVVDLSGLGAAHSVVLSLLLCWLRLARSRNQSLSLEGAGDRLRSLARLSGLNQHLPGIAEPSAGHS